MSEELLKRGRMLQTVYHFDDSGKLRGSQSDIEFDPLEYAMKNKLVPLLPANSTVVAPAQGLARQGDLYFSKERQTWYVVKSAVNSEIKQPEQSADNAQLSDVQDHEAHNAAKLEIENLIDARRKSFDVDGFKAAERMYLEMTARQYLRDWKEGKKADPGWLSLLAAAERRTVVDYAESILKKSFRTNSTIFKLKAIKAKYLRLLRAASAGPRIDYLLIEARKEIGTFQPYDEVKMEDI
jgi:ribosomal protein S8